jgi:murein DD-endopeptidase MepM/ murein hydrolase activator NlpD
LKSLRNSALPAVKRFFSGKAKKYLFVALLSGGALYAFSGWQVSLVQSTSQASGGSPHLNSQTVALLEPAVNIDPNPSKGGGDIAILDGEALYAEGSLSDSDIERPASSEISIHIVRQGETLSEIAELYSVSVNTIAWANDIKGRVIHPGQELVILPITGVRHTVVKGETLASIAKKYKGDLEEIANYNELAADSALTVGEIVIVPDGTIAPPPSSSGTSPLRGTTGPSIAGYYLWPVAGGQKTQGLHGYNGIDIGAPAGTSIYSAAAGTVIVSRQGGWNGGYGNYVVVQHGNGTQTLYAHATSILVSVGEQVSQGQAIATIGRTGRATGNHLHFEVRGAKNPF